jgi:hypothetical protein
MFELHTSLPWGWIAVGFLVIVVIIVLYRIRLKALPSLYRYIIIVLRSAFLVMTLLLFINPEVTWVRRVSIPPRIGIFLDNSLSMANHPTAAASTVFARVKDVVSWAEEYQYQPEILTFGERLERQVDKQFEYLPDERITEFDPLSDYWANNDLQAIFLFSDGVATSGVDPGALTGASRAPIYVVGVGDTARNVDLSILDVHYPLTMLEQERNNLAVRIRAVNATGRRSRLFIFNEDQLIHSELISFRSKESIQSFNVSIVGRLEAVHFRVELMVFPEEINIENNRRELEIDVLPGRRQVALLTGGLSPNTSHINRGIREVRHAIVEHLVFIKGKWQGDEGKFWETPLDLIVLDNYPTTFLPEGHLDRLIAKIDRDKSAVLLVEGPDNNNRDFIRLGRALGLPLKVVYENDNTSPSQLTPVGELPGLSIQRGKYAGNSHAAFPAVNLVHAVDVRPNVNLSTVLMDNERSPVVAYGIVDELKRALLLLPDLATTHMMLSRTNWQNYLQDILLALLEWELEPEGFSPYILQPDKRQYHLGEKVLLRGILRDRAGIKMLQPVLSVEIDGPVSSKLVTLSYNFDSGEYEGEFWPGDPGAYRMGMYQEESTIPHTRETRFQVLTGRIELESITQDRYSLERLSQTSGGSYTNLNGVDELLTSLFYQPELMMKEHHFSLWQVWYLWVALIFVLGLEWSLRRIMGLI